MSAVLVHIGCTGPYINGTRPPAHMESCIDQYQLFNDDDLYILTDKENLPYLPKRKGVFPFAIEDYHSDKVSRLESLYNFGPREFWTVVITRFIYIENFLRENDIRHICEFANDVLVYFSIEEYNQTFERLYNNLALTPCGPQHTLDGFMYINNYQSLDHMTSFFIKSIADLGLDGIKRKYGFDMVNEMTLMKYYADEDGADCVGALPILPWGEHSRNYDEFGAIFDPASWGQFVSGTRTGDPGVRLPNHYVGQVLMVHPQYRVDWRVENGLRVPYFSYDGNLVKIDNLHIHSKNMRPYMSKECE